MMVFQLIASGRKQRFPSWLAEQRKLFVDEKELFELHVANYDAVTRHMRDLAFGSFLIAALIFLYHASRQS